jgi:DNA-binding CsgD family transcriptional regulator
VSAADVAWGRWREAIDRRDPVALGALTRLGTEIRLGVVSKRHDWEPPRPGHPRYLLLRPPSALSLTENEKALLRAYADGATIRTASARLGKGRETIKTQLRTIVAKLEARNTTHAVAEAIRRGVI